MEYPKELIQEASLRMNGRPVEGFIAGQGPLHPKLMLVGEAPGKTEIDTHVPFSGQAGKELMQALSSTGLTREEVYIIGSINGHNSQKLFIQIGHLLVPKYLRMHQYWITN